MRKMKFVEEAAKASSATGAIQRGAEQRGGAAGRFSSGVKSNGGTNARAMEAEAPMHDTHSTTTERIQRKK